MTIAECRIAPLRKATRPASGSVRWNPTTNAWEVRVTLADGTRSRPIAMTGLGLLACAVAPAEPPRRCTCAPCKAAKAEGRAISERIRTGGYVDDRFTAEASTVSAPGCMLFEPMEWPALPGCYFVNQRAPNDPIIKIGWGDPIVSRRQALQTGSGWPIEVLTYIPSADPGDEDRLHAMFGRHRLCYEGAGSEWFRPAEPLLAFIREARTILFERLPTFSRDLDKFRYSAPFSSNHERKVARREALAPLLRKHFGEIIPRPT